MFCKNCGIELQEGVKFCPECGTDVNAVAKKKINITVKNKKILVIFSVILAAIIFLICINANGVNSSPEKVAAAIVKSEYEIDIDTMLKCFPDFTLKDIAVDEGLPSDASYNEIKNAVKKAYRYETPYKVKIVNVEEIGSYDISEYTIFRERYDFMTDSEYSSITKIAKVKVEFYVDGEADSETITCIKMKGKWYYLRILY